MLDDGGYHVSTVCKIVEKSEDIDPNNLDSFLAGGAIEPKHPGIMYYNLIIKGGGLSVTAVADRADVSREMLHRIFRGEAAITARTAIGLAEAAGNTPEFWLRAQQVYDLWKERRRRSSSPPLLEM